MTELSSTQQHAVKLRSDDAEERHVHYMPEEILENGSSEKTSIAA